MGKFMMFALVGLAMLIFAGGVGFAIGATMIEPENSCSIEEPAAVSRG